MSTRIAASFFVIDFIVCLMLTTYLRRFGQNRVRLLRPQVGLLVLTLGAVVTAKVILLNSSIRCDCCVYNGIAGDSTNHSHLLTSPINRHTVRLTPFR